MAQQRNSRWQASVYDADRKRVRAMFDTRLEAERWEAAAKEAVAKGKPIPDAHQNGAESRPGGGRLTTLGTLFEHVCRTEWDTRKSAKTLILNGRAVVDYFGAKKDIREITSVDTAELRMALAEKGNSTATVNRKLAALSKMLHVAKDAGALPGVPKMHMRREEQTRFRYLDKDEEKLLLAYWEGMDDLAMRDLCIFLIDTGARCFKEAMPVKWDQFSQGYTSVTFWETKTGKPRTVPLTPRCREMLERRKNVRTPFYGIMERTVRSRWDDMRRILGFPDVTPHTLRHTCCTRLILGGADVKRVMTWMGHSSIQTTMRYMQVRTTDLDALLDILAG